MGKRRSARRGCLRLAALVLITLMAASVAARGAVTTIYTYGEPSPAPNTFTVFNNSTNSPPLWTGNLVNSSTMAYLNVTGNWASAIATDDSGNIFWTSTYGLTYARYVLLTADTALGSPFSSATQPGEVTSIAAVNFTSLSAGTVALVALLTVNGYVYFYNESSGQWLNATSAYSIPLPAAGGEWSSMTANTNGYVSGGGEYFYFTDTSGSVYRFDPAAPAGSGWLNQNASAYGIVATAAYQTGQLYGLAFNGTVLRLAPGGWAVYGKTSAQETCSLAIGNDGTNFGNSYIFVIDMKNQTPVFASNSPVSGTGLSNTSSFAAIGVSIDVTGTNEGIAYQKSAVTSAFYVIETNGTLLESRLNTSLVLEWPVFGYGLVGAQHYAPLLLISSLSSSAVDIYLTLGKLSGKTYVQSLQVNLVEGNGSVYREVSYEAGGQPGGPGQNAPLQASASISVNITMLSALAFNSSALLFVQVCPSSGTHTAIVQYEVMMAVTNHFSYTPVV